jgi:DNA-binding response OmpR family regulator
MKMKITILALLVAVTPQTRATIHRAFRPNDFEVVWAASPSEALAASAQHRPDLLLLGLHQSGRKDREIIERLRTVNPGAPVVVLAEPRAADPDTAADPTAVVLQKPFDVAVLARTIRTLLQMPPAEAGEQSTGAADTSGEYREALRLRATTPLSIPNPYHRWGINE